MNRRNVLQALLTAPFVASLPKIEAPTVSEPESEGPQIWVFTCRDAENPELLLSAFHYSVRAEDPAKLAEYFSTAFEEHLSEFCDDPRELVTASICIQNKEGLEWGEKEGVVRSSGKLGIPIAIPGFLFHHPGSEINRRSYLAKRQGYRLDRREIRSMSVYAKYRCLWNKGIFLRVNGREISLI